MLGVGRWGCSPSYSCGDGVGSEALELLGPPVARERQAERVQEGEGLGVRVCRRGDGDVETAHLVDRVVIDLREDDLLPDSHVVVATPVEGLRVQAPEVAQTRD